MCPWYILLRLLQDSLRLPDASPRVHLHGNREVGSQRVPLSLAEGSRWPGRQRPLEALRAAGNCSPLGVLKRTLESARMKRGAQAATLSRRHGPARRASLKLTPSPNTFSFPAWLPHVSLTLFTANPFLLPALT